MFFVWYPLELHRYRNHLGNLLTSIDSQAKMQYRPSLNLDYLNMWTFQLVLHNYYLKPENSVTEVMTNGASILNSFHSNSIPILYSPIFINKAEVVCISESCPFNPLLIKTNSDTSTLMHKIISSSFPHIWLFGMLCYVRHLWELKYIGFSFKI